MNENPSSLYDIILQLVIKSVHQLENSAEKLGIPFLIGGFIGAIVQRMRKRMSWVKFFSSVVLAMFVGWVVGVSLRSLFSLETSVVYGICSMAGAFSEDLLDEVEKLVGAFSDIVKNFINNKLN